MTEQKKPLDEKFESSFDVNASVADPVDTGSTKRPADQTGGEKEPKALTKAQMISGITHAAYKQSHPELTQLYREFFKLQGKNVDAASNRATIKAGGLKEDVETLFAGTEVTEEFKDTATTIFEAALNTAIIEETARLEESFEERLSEEVESMWTTMTESVEKYLDHVATQWLEENKLQVEAGLRADITESFIKGMKNLFVEHYIEVPDEAVDVVEALTQQVEDLTARLNESETAVIEARAALDEQVAAVAKAAADAERASILATVSEGLTDTQRETLATLSESVDFTDAATYAEKLKTISETVVQKKAPASGGAEQLNEAVDLLDESKKQGAIDPVVALALAAGKRLQS